jgi:hypothetical protein
VKLALVVTGMIRVLKSAFIEFLEKVWFFPVALPVIGRSISANGIPGLTAPVILYAASFEVNKTLFDVARLGG